MPINQSERMAMRLGDGELPDRELLRRFAADSDEAAFSAIIQRHGKMVHRVCQRVLERREDAEDAFQATFLVLAKKVGKVAWRESIGSWLHATAYRLAYEIRRSRIRRQIRETRRESPAPGSDTADSLADVSSREMLGILDEELASLPEEHRGPLLLCCMEGMTGDEAANHLGVSPSTVKRRLREAREMLHARLTRRGVALSMATLIALFATESAIASLPSGLASATVKAAVLFKAGAAIPPGLASAGAIQLTRHVLTIVSAKAALAIGLLAASVTALAVFAGRGAPVVDKAPVKVAAKVAAVKPADGEPAFELPEMPAAPRVGGVRVTIDSTLRTNGAFIRQWAFDGNPLSFYASADSPGDADHVTMTFDQPVPVKSVRVKTGTPNDTWLLEKGQLEISADGTTFEPLADFDKGAVDANAGGRRILAVRVRPTAQGHPLVIREFVIDSDPALLTFRHPVEFEVDVTDAPEMAKWAHRAARACERAYPMICEELAADGYRPPSRIPLIVRYNARALAGAADGRVIVSAGYFEANPQDIGAVIHATTYIVQGYKGQSTPNWLVQGIADYIRYFKFEPDTLGPLDAAAARHDGDSRETAAFLAWLVENHDPLIVRKLNAALREGRYSDEIWITLTRKPLHELGDDWRRTLRR